MQEQTTSRHFQAQQPLYSPIFAQAAPQRSAYYRKPQPAVLTQAELRAIIIEQLG